MLSPSRPDPPAEAYIIGLEVEWMRVSSRSSTSVFGRWKGALYVAALGVDERDAVERFCDIDEREGCATALGGCDWASGSELSCGGGMSESEGSTVGNMGSGGMLVGGRDGDAGNGGGIAGGYGLCETSNNTDFASLLSSSLSFSSSSVPSSTATSCAVRTAPCRASDLQAAQMACQSSSMIRTKNILRRTAPDVLFGRIAFSVDDTEGRLDGGLVVCCDVDGLREG